MKNKQDKYLIFPLFSTPLVVTDEIYQFKKSELKYIKKLKTKANTYNRVSLEDQVLQSPELRSLKKHLQKWLHIYAYEFLKITDVKFYITQSWCNYNSGGDKHHAHHHPNSLVSGVFFIQGNETPIEFSREKKLFPMQLNHKSFDIYNAQTYSINMDAGKLFLFPSSLIHSVKENISNTQRISLSFNTFAKGEFGKQEHREYLKLT
jgi:uncharacterized protein (TIGR02466 family)|tara:strand:- start:434 stop:1051 length:618 start_codon:yes stop_codon:yes gene_type:complete